MTSAAWRPDSRYSRGACARRSARACCFHTNSRNSEQKGQGSTMSFSSARRRSNTGVSSLLGSWLTRLSARRRGPRPGHIMPPLWLEELESRDLLSGVIPSPIPVQPTSPVTVVSNGPLTVTSAPVAPTVTLGGPYAALTAHAIAFTCSATDSSSQEVPSGFVYSWNFGDGSTSDIEEPQPRLYESRLLQRDPERQGRGWPSYHGCHDRRHLRTRADPDHRPACLGQGGDHGHARLARSPAASPGPTRKVGLFQRAAQL